MSDYGGGGHTLCPWCGDRIDGATELKLYEAQLQHKMACKERKAIIASPGGCGRHGGSTNVCGLNGYLCKSCIPKRNDEAAKKDEVEHLPGRPVSVQTTLMAFECPKCHDGVMVGAEAYVKGWRDGHMPYCDPEAYIKMRMEGQ